MRRQRERLWIAAGLSLVLVVVLSGAWFVRDVGYASDVASLVGVSSVIVAVSAWARRGAPRHSACTAEQLDAAAEALAHLVTRQWEQEVSLRWLEDPRPLTVRWRDTGRPVADHRELIGSPVVCRADDMDGLVTAFQQLRQRRLVVIGPAGSGKTTLAVLLTLALLRRREPGEPVPLLLSLSSFDPSRETLSRWVHRSLSTDYPALANPDAYGTSAVRDLIGAHRVLLVLDGLDEVPARYQADVLTALNDSMNNQSLVVTCRTAEFESAVAHGDVLTAAAVIEPQPLTPRDSIDFLRLATPPGSRQQHWRALAAHVVGHPQSALAGALASPLTVSLVRALYSSGSADPTELANSTRFPDAKAIEHHLLGSLVPTLLARHNAQALDAPHRTRRWAPASAQRWLSHLARFLHQHNSHDLAWWQLYRAVPGLSNPWLRSLLTLLSLTVGATTVAFLEGSWKYPHMGNSLDAHLLSSPHYVLPVVGAALIAPLAVRPTGMWRRVSILVGAAAGAVGAFLGSCMAWLAYPYRAGVGIHYVVEVSPQWILKAALEIAVCTATVGAVAPPIAPRYATLTLRGRRRHILYAIASVPVYSVTFSLAFGLTIFFAGSEYLLSNFSNSLVPATLLAIMLAGVRATHRPLGSESAADPVRSVRADRRWALLCAAFLGIFFLAADTAWLRSAPVAFDLWQSVQFNFRYSPERVLRDPNCLTFAAIGALTALLASSWAYFGAARIWLALRGRGPLRLLAFLEDAHRLGILRRVGPVYQFKHARLRDHLANCGVVHDDAR